MLTRAPSGEKHSDLVCDRWRANQASTTKSAASTQGSRTGRGHASVSRGDWHRASLIRTSASDPCPHGYSTLGHEPAPGHEHALGAPSVRTGCGSDGSVRASRFPVFAVLGDVSRLLSAVAWLILACLLTLSPPSRAATPRNVLVLYSYGRLLPGNIAADRGLSEAFATRPDLAIEASAEFLDNPRFSGEAYERAFVTYLREKYAAHPPEVIIASANEALDFLLRYRAELFAQIPIVHMSVSSEYLQSAAPLSPDVVGTPLTYDFVGTIEQAVRWHPAAVRLVVVTGASPWDKEWEARVRAQAAGFPKQLSVEFMAGLPAAELQQAVGQATGRYHRVHPRLFPRRQRARVHAARGQPAHCSRIVGAGLRAVLDLHWHRHRRWPHGQLRRHRAPGAETAIELLDGASPASLTLPAAMPTPLQVDWRQLQRWGISPQAVPADAIVHFKEPTLWEAYRQQVITAGVVMLLQAGLIVALLLERRRRRRTAAALTQSEQHMRLAAHAASLSTWVLDGRALPVAHTAFAAPKAGQGSDPLVDFRATLARVHPQDREVVDAALRNALATREEFEVEYRIAAPDGEWRWQSARGRAEHGQAPRLLGVVIDITQRKRAEVQAEQDRAALSSHDTRLAAGAAFRVDRTPVEPAAGVHPRQCRGRAEDARARAGRPAGTARDLRRHRDRGSSRRPGDSPARRPVQAR